MTRSRGIRDAAHDPLAEPTLRWDQLLELDAESVSEAMLRRTRPLVRPLDAVHVEMDGRRLVNFASNNYLGLTHHPAVVAAAKEAIGTGTGSGAAALISGYTPAHASLESSLVNLKQTESAVLLPSGYQANLAAVQTLTAVTKVTKVTKGTKSRLGARFLLDKLCHASLIDAVLGSGAEFRIFPHNQLAKLRRLLTDAPPSQTQVVVTESIYSMDGDAADLRELAAIKNEMGFVWLLDEAHATGVYGLHGSGLAAEMGVSSAVDVQIVTLSKALGSIGGAICGSAAFCQAVLNHGRAYVFSTSLPASAAAAAEAAINVMASEPQRITRLRALAGHFRRELGLGGDCPIVPWILGGEAQTLAAATGLREKGFLVGAVRPPTVPRGSSRLRITLTSEHTDHEVADLLAALRSAL